MEINNTLIEQWEPKIHKLLANTFVVGMDKDDIAQELRISIIKAAKGFDEDRGVIFHTYLHTAMVNTLRTLISKGQRQQINISLETTLNDSEMVPSSILKALEDPTNTFEVVEFNNLLNSLNLTDIERSFITLKLEGLTMDEISEDLQTSAYKLRSTLRDRLGVFFGQ
jgi:RNA polymerase sigma factor (sigma-70 family)|tara:strand:- start:2545 stop:3048 length:504 start_codon:yes stop_codon:yes gene_type:complete